MCRCLINPLLIYVSWINYLKIPCFSKLAIQIKVVNGLAKRVVFVNGYSSYQVHS